MIQQMYDYILGIQTINSQYLVFLKKKKVFERLSLREQQFIAVFYGTNLFCGCYNILNVTINYYKTSHS